MIPSLIRRALYAALCCGLCTPALAAWPDDRPIELVVGFAAGGETDVLARTLAPYLQKHLSPAANIIVVNKPGASGAIANTYVQRAAKDGYTVAMVNTPPMNFMPLVQATPYDPARFALIGRVVSDPTLLVARADSPHASLKDLVSAVKSGQADVSIGQNGLGSNGGVALNLLMQESGAPFTEVPFTGTGQSKVALLGGHVDMIFSSHTAVPDPAAEQTKLRILAQFVDQRAPMLPDVPPPRNRALTSSFPPTVAWRWTPACPPPSANVSRRPCKPPCRTPNSSRPPVPLPTSLPTKTVRPGSRTSTPPRHRSANWQIV
ncbi:putative lipoprotein [Bordetella trematum]|nr:putative lipoprotein [Bordetella trematum]